VAAVILGGGAGTRLFPLTKRRAKPAVRIAYSSCTSCNNKVGFFNFTQKDANAMNANNLHVVQRQVPIGGAYRLIDVPMSNCINSGINKVYILTQFNSASLNRHLARAYSFGSGINFGDGYVEVLYLTSVLLLLTISKLLMPPSRALKFKGRRMEGR